MSNVDMIGTNNIPHINFDQKYFKTSGKILTMNTIRKFALLLFIFVKFPRMECLSLDTSSDTAPEYEPLYVIDKFERFAVSSKVTFDETLKKLVVFEPKKDTLIQSACPKKNGDGVILETIDEPISSRIPLWLICDKPVEPYIEKFPNSDHYSVGFLIYKKGANYQYVNLNNALPPTQNSITLIVINFDQTGARPVYVWHQIDSGEWIQIDSIETTNDLQYQSNDDIYGFFVEKLYFENNLRDNFASTFNKKLPSPLLKIQLAPAEDFFFDNYKKMSRINLNTAPIWQNILPQWRSLEIFVRKVARVLDKLHVITGTYDTLSLPDAENTTTKPFYLAPDDQKLPVPKYLWKAIMSYYGPHDDQTKSYGILFIMLNDPYFDVSKRRKQKPICKNIIKETGWEFYTEPNATPKSEMLACLLTRENMSILGGPMLPIPKYQMFNLHSTIKSYFYEWTEKRKIGGINVIRKLQSEGLL